VTSTDADAPEPSSPAALAEVLDGVRCVMFDFDGPLCPLYEERPSDGLARTFHRILDDAGLRSPQLSGLSDPYGMLRSLPHSFPGRMFEGDRLLRSVASVFGEHLTLEELERVGRADPTEGAVECVKALYERGFTLAIATNNAPESVQTYLKSHGIDRMFAGRIFGRGWDPRRMKPHPDTVERALTAVAPDGITRDQCVLLGDTPGDLAAARGAGVRFIGYCRSAAKARRLTAAGTRYWVASLDRLSEAFGDA
jgi:beta-phosphoglucomutase-like phosphatase (HAD superfamily)